MRSNRLKVRPLPFSCGVYLLLCLITGKVYIGSSGSSMRQRGYYHRGMLEANNHDNGYLQNAYNKHGAEAFEFSVVELWDDPDTVTQREQFWIRHFEATDRDKGYNLAEDATRGPMLGRHHSEETCKKLSEASSKQTEHHRKMTKAAAKANRGKHPVFTEEHKRNISNAMSGRKQTLEARLAHWTRQPGGREANSEAQTGKTLSEDHKAAISAGCKGQKRTDEQKQHYSDGHWTKGPNAAEIMARRSEKARLKRIAALEAKTAALEAEAAELQAALNALDSPAIVSLFD